MTPSRREFIVLTGAAVQAGMFGVRERVQAAPEQPGGQPWYATMRRCGQTNFNERDPLVLDIGWWIEYWKQMKLDALLLNGGGIMAFYPTKIPYHHRSQYLGSRDLFGDFLKAGKQAGMRVVARMDCNYVYEEAYQAYPEWVERQDDGQPLRHPQSPWLYKTCMFSTYFTEQMPAIYDELNSLYDIDALYTNGWPGTNRPSPCFCDTCRGLGDPKSPGYYRAYLDRVLSIWAQWDRIAKQKKPDSVYVGNLGGSIRAVADLMDIATVAGWFNADNQGRFGQTPIWDCAQQGRVAQAVMKGRPITNVTGAYAVGQPLWRHTAKARQETTLWLAQTTASGMIPWFHWLGGTPEDLRWQKTGTDFFEWIAANKPHFTNKRSIANLAVVFSQRTNALYHPPGGTDTTEFLQGLYYALLEGRYLFDFVHEQDLGPNTLGKYQAVLLPNVAMLSDAQCTQLRDYVAGGGSLLGSFETSRYREWGERREQPGLADIFDFQVTGDTHEPNGSAYYARIEGPHEILQGFDDTRVLPGAEYRLPLRTSRPSFLTVIPPYPAFPPEMVYTDTPHTDEPAIVVRERGDSRLVWLAGDVDRSFWRSGDGDLSLLLQNAVRWLLRDRQPVRVDGEGIVDLFAWETEAGIAVHIVNYTSPNMLRGWVRSTVPLGPQRLRVGVADAMRVTEVRALGADKQIEFRQDGTLVTCELPRVADYEVVVLT